MKDFFATKSFIFHLLSLSSSSNYSSEVINSLERRISFSIMIKDDAELY